MAMANSEEQSGETSSTPAAPLPILSPGKFYGDQLGVLNPNFLAGGGQQTSGPDYLTSKQRPPIERMVYNTGICYLGGILFGGMYGMVHGARNSPSSRFRIRVNTVLNGITTKGSKLGNAVGVMGTSFNSFMRPSVLFDYHVQQRYTLSLSLHGTHFACLN